MKKKILIIDDDKMSLMILKATLEKAGYEVTEARNGRIGEEINRHCAHDLIITDIFMPEKDGITTILELRREFKNVKIIAISGGGAHLGSRDYLEHARDFGAQASFTKPVDTTLLLEEVERLLSQ